MKTPLLALAVCCSAFYSYAQTGCSELFFSEIVEGAGNNKAIEIYNPTSNPIALSNYRIVRYSNGSTAGTDSLQLTGTVAPHDVWVVVNGQTTSQQNSPACDTALQAMADQLSGTYPDPLYENGNDAIGLIKISPRQVVDLFGKIGEDPGVSWTDVFPYTDAQGAYWTKDHTLIRKSSVTQGVTVNPVAFNVTTEYDSLPKDTWTNLGIHNSSCSTSGINETGKNNFSLVVFPNPSEGIFNVNASSTISTIEIYNTLGELVFSKNCNHNSVNQEIDLSGFSSGLFEMQVETTNGNRVSTKISIR